MNVGSVKPWIDVVRPCGTIIRFAIVVVGGSALLLIFVSVLLITRTTMPAAPPSAKLTWTLWTRSMPVLLVFSGLYFGNVVELARLQLLLPS